VVLNLDHTVSLKAAKRLTNRDETYPGLLSELPNVQA
jgi:hypothetical protein